MHISYVYIAEDACMDTLCLYVHTCRCFVIINHDMNFLSFLIMPYPSLSSKGHSTAEYHFVLFWM